MSITNVSFALTLYYIRAISDIINQKSSRVSSHLVQFPEDYSELGINTAIICDNYILHADT
jgi:hypothetical protein